MELRRGDVGRLVVRFRLYWARMGRHPALSQPGLFVTIAPPTRGGAALNAVFWLCLGLAYTVRLVYRVGLGIVSRNIGRGEFTCAPDIPGSLERKTTFPFPSGVRLCVGEAHSALLRQHRFHDNFKLQAF